MDNNFTGGVQGQTMMNEQPKKKGGALLVVVIILIVIIGVWFLIGDKVKNTSNTQALDQQIDSSIDGILSDLQSEDTTVSASSADLSDIYDLDINK